MTSFGERLLDIFGDVPKGNIAKVLGVKPSAVTNYLQDRVPDGDKLKRISDFTNCSIHWLITGEGEKYLNSNKQINLDETFRAVVREIIREELSRTNWEKVIGDLEREDQMPVASLGKVNDDAVKAKKRKAA